MIARERVGHPPNSLLRCVTKYIYQEKFPKGSVVRIADRSFLEGFLKTWKFHNKLRPLQLSYAGQITEVKSVGFYHGGDVLYELKDVPGIWRESCLEAVS
jgi:hypothetical protein